VSGLACVAGLAALAGCGGSGDGGADQGPPPVSARVVGGGTIPRVTNADFKGPIARYRAHVARELAAMQADVSELDAAASAGDLEAAKRAWLVADARYETIGAAYGAFGDLDAAINGRPGGLKGGPSSKDFIGLHRVELALWGNGSAQEAAPYAERLGSDVARLRAKVPGIEIDPLDYALRSHEVLEDTLQLELSGDASPWAGAALVALRSNLEGTEFVLGTLRPLVKRRNPQRLREIDASLAELRAALRRVTLADGSLPRWGSLSQRRRELIYGRTAAAAEQLAYVPEIADPRPPPAPKSVFGQEEVQQ
jgi:high-affinity iron transporter